MNILKLFTPVVAVFMTYPLNIMAADGEDINEQLEYLKEEVEILQDQLEEINQGSLNKMSISGYTDIEYHDSNREGSEPGFRLHHLSLFFEKRLSDKWKFFSEIEYEDAPYFEGKGEDIDPADPDSGKKLEKANGKIFVEAVNFTYFWDPKLNLRAGRFFTPAGIWSVDHYPSFVPTQIRPQHIREIFPQVVDGVMASGTFSLAKIFLNYDLYLGNGEGNTGKEDQNSKKGSGLKLSLLVPSFNYFEIGGSFYQDTLNDTTKKMAVGGHLKMKLASLTLQSEYAQATIEPQGSEAYDRIGYYAQLSYDTNSWTFGLRHDFYDEDNSVENADVIYESAFVNYHVNESVVVKLEHHFVNYEDPLDDYQETIASVVLYLGN